MQTDTQKPSKPIKANTPTAVIPPSVFAALPDSALLRKAQLVQPAKHPDVPAPLPFGEQTLWRRVREQTFPAPIRLSSRMSVWKCGDVRAWIAAQGAL
ncbi:MAG: AlpA family phage regulatory protein [Rhodoferax sp.]|nr:AlpA family phage regulatory protein [Rhodoferax sp.]